MPTISNGDITLNMIAGETFTNLVVLTVNQDDSDAYTFTLAATDPGVTLSTSGVNIAGQKRAYR